MRSVMRLTVKLVLLTLFFSFNNLVRAAELYQPGLQTRCLAMGGTCVSQAHGASALFFNPAALANVEGFDFIIAQVYGGISKDAVDFSSQFQGSTFTATDINRLYGKTLTVDISGRSGFVMPNFGFGVFSNSYTNMQFDNPTFPTFNMSLINEYGYIIGGAFSLGGKTSFGITTKNIKRSGGVEDIGVSTLLGQSTGSLASTYFQDRGVGQSVDIALMTTLEGALKPTLSLVWQDVGVTAFSLASGVKAPPSQYDNLIFGVSMQQDIGFIGFTHAFEYKFIKTSGYDLSQKLHLGTEISFGLFDLRAGINQGYVTYGAGLDLWFFQLDAAAYATELGAYTGQAQSDRYSVSLTFNMDFDQSFKLKDAEGKKRRLKQRR